MLPKRKFLYFTFLIFVLISSGCTQRSSDIEDIPIIPFEKEKTQQLVRIQALPIKGLLDQSLRDIDLLLTEELDNIRALGVNTLYVYVNYVYIDGKLTFDKNVVGSRKELTDEEIINEYIKRIVNIKNKGFAVYLTRTYHDFEYNAGISLEEFLIQAEKEDLRWAEIAENYQVEYFAPSSELEWRIFDYYYKSQPERDAVFDDVVEIVNKFHEDILPKIREVFKGKVVMQSGQTSPNSGVKDYDLFGGGTHTYGAELSTFREERVRKGYKIAETNGKRQGSGWIVVEFWAPIREEVTPGQEGKLLYSPKGIAYIGVQHEFYRIAIEEYKNWSGDIKPVGFTFTSYLNPSSTIKGRPAEELVKDFFNKMK